MTNGRHLSLRSATFLVIANMVGVGVFTTSGFALQDLGSRWLVMLAWLLGGSLQQTPGAAQVGLDLRAGDHLYCGYFHGVDGWFPLVAFEGGLLWEAVLRSTLVTWGFAQEPST